MSYVQDCYEFSAFLSREYPTVPTSQIAQGVAKLLPLANRHQQIAVTYCNRELTVGELADYDENIPRKLEKINADHFDGLLRFDFSGDPRGATVKLTLQNPHGNSFGSRFDYCVPTKNY